MNIKSLILGSATVALAATGAQAADAIIIAEPEPVEYVRVCDVYGAGYFYIPGTETCLKISGWVRHQVDSRIQGNVKATVTNTDGQVIDSGKLSLRERGMHQGTGAQINLDARSETEYGTLRGWVQLEGSGSNRYDADPKDIDIYINRAVIQLGGLYMGFADSLFSSSSNIGGSSLGNYGGYSFADTFDYHYSQRHQIGYQFSGGNGFWGAIGLEHNGRADRFTAGTESWTPNIVGKLAYQQAWGGAWLAAAYDDEARGFGVRGGVEASFSPLTVRLDGYYRSKANVAYGPSVNVTGAWKDGEVFGGARWGIQGTALYQINPKFGIAAGLGYYDDLAINGETLHTVLAEVGYTVPIVGITNDPVNQYVGGNAWTAQLGLNWTPVQNFQIGADVIHRKASFTLVDTSGNTGKIKADATSFRLRFQRNF